MTATSLKDQQGVRMLYVASGTDVAQPFVELSSRIQMQNRA